VSTSRLGRTSRTTRRTEPWRWDAALQMVPPDDPPPRAFVRRARSGPAASRPDQRIGAHALRYLEDLFDLGLCEEMPRRHRSRQAVRPGRQQEVLDGRIGRSCLAPPVKCDIGGPP
jgi:hypothetical protein